MAEFESVMKQVKRMCSASPGTFCNPSCPLLIEAAKVGKSCSSYIRDCPEMAEAVVMVWAAKNPTAYYGTYLEYLQEVLPGATIKASPSYCPREALFGEECEVKPCGNGQFSCNRCLSEPILEKTALRLGLEPETEVKTL